MMNRMNYLEQKSLVDDLNKFLSEYVIGKVTIDEIMTLDPGLQKKYYIRINNAKMNFNWSCIFDVPVDDWDAKLFDELLEKYKEAIYTQFFFY